MKIRKISKVSFAIGILMLLLGYLSTYVNVDGVPLTGCDVIFYLYSIIPLCFGTFCLVFRKISYIILALIISILLFLSVLTAAYNPFFILAVLSTVIIVIIQKFIDKHSREKAGKAVE